MLSIIKNSSFIKSVASLSSGTMVAAIIPILAAPILGRLYLPSDYGVLATYISIASVLSAIGNWQYAKAIIIEDRDCKADLILSLCFFTSILTSIVALLISMGIFFYAVESTEWEMVRIWFIALPFSTFIGGMTAAYSAMANRLEMYRFMAIVQIVSVGISVFISILLGVYKFGYQGLMISYLVGQIITFFVYWFVISKQKSIKPRISLLRLKVFAKKHKDFALFTAPTAFIGNFSMQSPIYVLGLISAVDMIGFFSRARQLLSMPINLLGGSVAKVFQRRLAVEYQRTGNCKLLFIKTFFTLVGLGFLPTLFLALLAPDLFEIFLGENWRFAGEVARILAPMLYLRFICSPLATIFYIVGAQREDAFLTTVMTVFTFLAVITAYFLYMTPISIIIGYCIGESVNYCVYIIRSYSLSKMKVFQEVV